MDRQGMQPAIRQAVKQIKAEMRRHHSKLIWCAWWDCKDYTIAILPEDSASAATVLSHDECGDSFIGRLTVLTPRDEIIHRCWEANRRVLYREVRLKIQSDLTRAQRAAGLRH